MQFIKDYQTVISAILVTITLASALLGLWRKIKGEFLKGVLRLQIWSDTLPLSERVEAGHIYLKNNWNGPTSVRIAENLEEFKREVRRDGQGKKE